MDSVDALLYDCSNSVESPETGPTGGYHARWPVKAQH